jgi:iron complex transport system substrate-binding protein
MRVGRRRRTAAHGLRRNWTVSAIALWRLAEAGCLILLCLLPAAAAPAGVEVTDDAGHAVTLPAPARRIISLAPHVTELLFAAGAGEYVVGVSAYSDYPPAARAIPRVGGGGGLDLEAVVSLRPDLVVAWQSGNPRGQIGRLRELGLTGFVSEPRELDDVADNLERLGELAGTRAQAGEAAARYRRRLAQLRASYSGRSVVRVFYEVWNRPLMTINGSHLISNVIRLCGGRNIFADLPVLAPQVDPEAVLSADPDAILTGGMAGAQPEWLDAWRRWPRLHAVRNGHLHAIPGDLLVRHTPRILDGAELLCRYLDRVRLTLAGS